MPNHTVLPTCCVNDDSYRSSKCFSVPRDNVMWHFPKIGPENKIRSLPYNKMECRVPLALHAYTRQASFVFGVTSIAVRHHDWLQAELTSGGSKTIGVKQASLVYLNFLNWQHVVIILKFCTSKQQYFPNSKVVSCSSTFVVAAVKISLKFEQWKYVKSADESENILTQFIILYVGEAALSVELSRCVAVFGFDINAMCQGMTVRNS